MGGWDENESYGDWMGVWIGFDWLRIGNYGSCYECGDEPSGFSATELVKVDVP
jgi:hypothetical protein